MNYVTIGILHNDVTEEYRDGIWNHMARVREYASNRFKIFGSVAEQYMTNLLKPPRYKCINLHANVFEGLK